MKAGSSVATTVVTSKELHIAPPLQLLNAIFFVTSIVFAYITIASIVIVSVALNYMKQKTLSSNTTALGNIHWTYMFT